MDEEGGGIPWDTLDDLGPDGAEEISFRDGDRWRFTHPEGLQRIPKGGGWNQYRKIRDHFLGATGVGLGAAGLGIAAAKAWRDARKTGSTSKKETAGTITRPLPDVRMLPDSSDPSYSKWTKQKMPKTTPRPTPRPSGGPPPSKAAAVKTAIMKGLKRERDVIEKAANRYKQHMADDQSLKLGLTKKGQKFVISGIVTLKHPTKRRKK